VSGFVDSNPQLPATKTSRSLPSDRGLHGSGVTEAGESDAQIFVFSGSGKNYMAALTLEEQHM